MTIKPSVRISSDGRLVVRGRTVLSGVPENVTVTAASDTGAADGVFLGSHFSKPACRHVVSLGTLRDVRFMACFRFKLWWMSQKMGDRGRDIPLETQFLLLEIKDDENSGEPFYSVFLPSSTALSAPVSRASGDTGTAGASFSHSVFLSAGQRDPFAAVSDAVSAASSHLQTFRQRLEKKLPPIVDLFGWCTWDAFYQEVTQEGVEAGLQSLAAGGAPARFVIIDDGWQSVGLDQSADGAAAAAAAPSLMRLTAIRENSKFQTRESPAEGIKSIVDVAKKRYAVSFVYLWHAITGYWGGVRPAAEGLEQYSPAMKFPEISPDAGFGLVDPKKVYQFYDELHSYLAAAGVDGVKVDVQSILETLGGGLGGRVELTRMYHQALDASVRKNFPDNGIIACMSHSSDALYHSKQTAVVRASDDFYPRDPVSHTIHIASVAYNSYHASARAISGGPVYVSDAPGKHNFDLLSMLVLPDGSILRALLPGRPTRDCLFSDPARDGVSLLKIWNMNKFTGVLGVYNCQGAAWCSSEKKNVFHHTAAEALTAAVRGDDVHLIADAAAAADDDGKWNGDCALYRHGGGASGLILQHEIFVVSPIKLLSPELQFAPLGLVDMFNAGGAVQGLSYRGGSSTPTAAAAPTVYMEIKGCGRLGAYSATRPRRCSVGSSAAVEFSYDSSSGLLLINLPAMPGGPKNLHSVVVEL
ncbi:unnamed protein product [Spirodela intermedia]|uniref:galactinol--sucrose galactosyltransferase n=1 Tax=Spirodela intermedia TaxID=51605 RepID=A0A7I8JR28_SPIIN|nr:unnamed protein product [Spirodela intermedia]CAA6672606.1 unnamed protein product [Spirodela intermedia]